MRVITKRGLISFHESVNETTVKRNNSPTPTIASEALNTALVPKSNIKNRAIITGISIL
jgi:hypothetical protein